MRNRPFQPSGKAVRGVIYPYVLKEDDGYRMWYGSFNDSAVDDRFHIYCAASKDGSHWKIRHDEAAFAALPESGRFDSKFVSTPHVVSVDRYLLYFRRATSELSTAATSTSMSDWR
jgi:hypothetical protein